MARLLGWMFIIFIEINSKKCKNLSWLSDIIILRLWPCTQQKKMDVYKLPARYPFNQSRMWLVNRAANIIHNIHQLFSCGKMTEIANDFIKSRPAAYATGRTKGCSQADRSLPVCWLYTCSWVFRKLWFGNTSAAKTEKAIWGEVIGKNTTDIV